MASLCSFERYGRKSKRVQFLETMEVIVQRRELEDLIEPHYRTASNGRQPVGLTFMLRTYFLLQWFNLSDPAAENAFYEPATLRRFAGLDLCRARRRMRPQPSVFVICCGCMICAAEYWTR